MAWTFDPALPSQRDQVRQLIGDTDVKKPELQDETLDFYITTDTSALSVAYTCACDLAAKYARIVEVTVDHQTTRGQQIADNYRQLAASLLSRMRSGSAGATAALSGIYVGGLASDGGLADYDGPYDYAPLPMLEPNE